MNSFRNQFISSSLFRSKAANTAIERIPEWMADQPFFTPEPVFRLR
jgi:hypothetical protein